MDTSRISFGEMVAAVSGLLLFLFMFLDWFGLSEGPFSVAANAWESFGFIDIVLFLVAIIAVGLAVARAAGAMPQLPYPPGLIIAAAGALAVLLILFRLLSPPDGGVDLDLDRKIGVFLGLLAAAGVTFGGWTAMNERSSGTGPGNTAGTGSGPGTGNTPGAGPGATPGV